MAVKIVVLYTRPGDPEEFDQHYLGTHMALVRKMPGLQRAESGRFTRVLDGGEQAYYRSADLYFADRDALSAALRSAEGKAVAADYQKIAPPGSRMFVQALDE